MSEQDLRRRMREDEVLPEADDAEERAWRTVRAAHAQLCRESRESQETLPGLSGDATRKRSLRPRPVGRGLAVAAALVGAALLISPAGAEVREWVGDRFGADERHAAPALTSLPGGGSLLVEASTGSWVVGAGGSKRLLGRFTDPTWSPRGLFVAAADGHQLTAMEPDGEPRWSLARPGAIGEPSWNSPDGYRIAYLERGTGTSRVDAPPRSDESSHAAESGVDLRVVAGDGSDDRPIASGVSAGVRPAWRPGPEYVLAYALPGGRARIAPTAGVTVRRDGPNGPDGAARRGDASSRELAGHVIRTEGAVRGLQWSADSTRLLVWTERAVSLFDRRGNRVWSYRPPGAGAVRAAALAPGSEVKVAVLEGGAKGSAVIAGPSVGRQVLFSAPGPLSDPTWSPNGRWLLVGWPGADQWLFLHPGKPERVHSVADISGQFAPGSTSPAAFPRILGWCC